MKLEGLLLKRAAANQDIETILQIFSTHMPPLKVLVIKPWRICETPFTAPHTMRLETPDGSYHYTNGRFLLNGHYSDYRIVYHPHFHMDSV
jgi:hypothetical protein